MVNDIVSFEQLGPGVQIMQTYKPSLPHFFTCVTRSCLEMQKFLSGKDLGAMPKSDLYDMNPEILNSLTFP